MSKKPETNEARPTCGLAAAPCSVFWRPIETAPEDDTAVDLWSLEYGRLPNYRRGSASRTNIYYDPVEYGISVVRDATHWMPIPSSPNAKDQPTPGGAAATRKESSHGN